MIITTDKENVLHTTENTFMVKTLGKREQNRNFINSLKDIYTKYVNIFRKIVKH